MSKERQRLKTSKDPVEKSDLTRDLLVVGIGASAGGIQALQEFFRNVRPDSGAAYVVILHLSPDHDSELAHVLSQVTALHVEQVKRKTKVEADHIYVVPPNRSLSMFDGTIVVKKLETIEERRAPVDIFFRTLAESHGSNAVGVVLSGTGANGSMGIKRIKEFGGATFAQNPREAQFNEMPRNSIATELIDVILPVAEIPGKILEYRDNRAVISIADEPEQRSDVDQAALLDIFTQLRVRTGHDFSNYKRPTILRRIERRISVRNLPDIKAYALYLRSEPDEVQALLKDLLISVTNFFRDKKCFDAIEKKVIPRLLDRPSNQPIRIWVAGCATGEEAYSFAMLLAEHTLGNTSAPPVQIFATDIDQQAIAVAREGLYTLNDAADVSQERLRRFFIKEGEKYRIRREIREMVLFAQHNLIKDPPFSHLDLVSCRNLLIYFNQVAQERVFEIIHFALEPGGYLFTGTSESVDGANDLFATVDKSNHIFQSRQVTTRPFPVPQSTPIYRAPLPSNGETPRSAAAALERFSYNDLHLKLLDKVAPPSIVINQDYEIVHLSESAGQYLQVAGGEPTNNLLRIVRRDIRMEVRSGLFQATHQGTNVEARGLKVDLGDRVETINLLIRPVVSETDTARGYILVVFEPAADGAVVPEHETYAPPEPVAQQLEEELIRSRMQLQSALEQAEIQSEELQASNEELQAMNEELRSSTEELETSKEELQSINEELTTVNQELKVKIDELSHTNNNFTNLLNSIDIGVIFLDRSLRVSLFSPAATHIFNLIHSDIGRPLADITSKITYDDLAADADAVFETLHSKEREVTTFDKRVYMVRMLPYRTAEDRLSGVVVTFVDVTDRTLAEAAVRRSEERLRRMVNVPLVGVVTFDYEGTLVDANDAFLKMIGYTRKEFEDGAFTWRSFTAPEYIEESERVMQGLVTEGTGGPYEREYIRKDGSRTWLMFVASNLGDGRIVEYAIDVSDRRRAEARAAVFEERHQMIVGNISDYAIFTMDAELLITSWNHGAENTFGWSADEAIGRPANIIFTSEDREAGTPEQEAETARATGSAPDERFQLHKDGSSFYVSGVMTPLKDHNGVIRGFVKIARDMTRTISAQKAILDRELLQKLVAAQEVERARLARDLHDELGQQLTVMRLRLDTLKTEAKAKPVQSELEDIDRIARGIDEGIDRITWELRPLALEDLGLVPALENYVGDWCGRAGLKCQLVKSSLRKSRFKPDVESNLFRIVQEALNNIAKHAKASKVEIVFERRGDELVLVIEDDGKGFNPKNKNLASKGLGLTSMHERAALMGGSLEVESAPRKGTTIYVRLPAVWALMRNDVNAESSNS